MSVASKVSEHDQQQLQAYEVTESAAAAAPCIVFVTPDEFCTCFIVLVILPLIATLCIVKFAQSCLGTSV